MFTILSLISQVLYVTVTLGYDMLHTIEGEQAFGQALWGWCVNMAARIAAVTRHCMDGTEEEFQDVLRSFFVSHIHNITLQCI